MTSTSADRAIVEQTCSAADHTQSLLLPIAHDNLHLDTTRKIPPSPFACGLHLICERRHIQILLMPFAFLTMMSEGPECSSVDMVPQLTHVCKHITGSSTHSVTENRAMPQV